ncbi:uncharacterized protein LOC115632875 [Scaptodrosophila lebanonensis]|uniref:Uncharacterized protein LOC115632875 n=1 Tax=Drosophila lebanonensis TaxID=7225 RepID=A0A6J2UC85_DROLE|nr:uncharacterized protein LOC115632875 [Scaptodrosophila lebanonensis]XP_030386010.1 uncharacterized protein LOC115632875 [Scaptodrosophila lebanonensis]XP_030386011.1 uncharacterized protein LOC115632875 [Scaptodrosophila lebanonensis]
MADYMAYLETGWENLPYLIIAYVLLTLLPKSFLRMKRFADADYEVNRHKYHRCYGPEVCCHVKEATAAAQALPGKSKARKPVTRVYPKRQQSVREEALVPVAAAAPVKRSNVTKIARMFETGATRQVNRVSPTLSHFTMPEIRMFGASGESAESTPCGSRKGSIATQLSRQLQNIEQPMHLWHELDEDKQEQRKELGGRNDWHSEPVSAMPVKRRTRGTSATPSTASPLSSSPEPASPVLLRQPLALCLKSSMEDIFQAIARSAEQEEPLFADCNSLAPVTCIDDIISERRFSRPLSAYSITDLLNEEQAAGVEEATYVNDTLQEQAIAIS